MRDSERNRLLDDLLEDAASVSFKATLLEQTLERVRQRRRVRRLRRSAAFVGVLIAGFFATWQWFVTPDALHRVSEAPARVVNSRPLPASMLVETKHGSASVFDSSAATIAQVETATAPRAFVEIDDEQLLALVSGHPAALVRFGPGQAELIFLNPEDEQGFPVP